MSFVRTVARRCNKNRNTQGQFLENICSEDDSIRDLEFSEHLLLNFLIACLSYDFHTPPKWYNCSFLMDFYPKKVT